jgi:hypothetical protein
MAWPYICAKIAWPLAQCTGVQRFGWKLIVKSKSVVLSVLQEIRDLSLCFQALKFSFLSRKCNLLAHTLAKQVTGNDYIAFNQET